MRPTRSPVQLSFLAASILIATGAAACPEIDRYPADVNEGQASQTGGAFVFGARAADDFHIPLGNGSIYNVRVIKAVLLANHTLTPTNVGITIYADGVSPTNPLRAQPGAVVSGPPNQAPTVRDLGPAGGTGFRAYEISYALPAGVLQLAADRWYWLSPYAIGSSTGSAAYAAISDAPGLVGEPINKSFGSPTSPDTYTTWTLTTDCCLGGPYDLAMYIDAVQLGRSPADINCSTLVTVQDLFDFLAAYFSGGPAGDFNGAGGTTVQDIFDFMAALFAS
jgi:hypothetical protein